MEWWKQLATAVVFGLGVATVLTLILTPSMLALRVWAVTYVEWIACLLGVVFGGRNTRLARDMRLSRSARKVSHPEIIWGMDGEPLVETPTTIASEPDAPPTEDEVSPEVEAPPTGPLRAASARRSLTASRRQALPAA